MNKSEKQSAWLDCYVNNEYDDPHQEFANELGISRIEAKELCYKIAYTVRCANVMQGYY